jgi:pimeloyl-ACP methyl ester carboxylesterase
MSSVIILVVLIAALSVLGTVYQWLGTIRDRKRFPPPGRMIDVSGHRLHINESGEGAPVVVLEAGIAASSLSWSFVQPEVAHFTRVLSYDRAGLGWSEASSERRTCAQSVDELHTLLRAAGAEPPYVLVGHSFGGCVVRLYAHRYSDEVAGIVLVDGLHPDEWQNPTAEQRRMLRGGALFSLFGALLARLGIVRACLSLLTRGQTWFPKLFVRSLGSGVSSTTGRIVGEVRKLPREVWPAVSALWCLPKCFHSMASHVRWLAESSAQAASANRLGDVPLIVLTKYGAHSAELATQESVARLSARGKHWVATQSGHWIHLDQPELVVHAIREVVEAVRREQRELTGKWVM